MNEDESFLRALLARPDDRVTKLVYADWLDDRADPRAEYLRLGVRVAELPHGHAERPELRQRMLVLQPSLPSWWVAIAGGLRAPNGDDSLSGSRVQEVAQRLGRQQQYTDAQGYEMTITAAATSGLTGAVAYLESRSQWRGTVHDITYTLRLRGPNGAATSWVPETYNPYFGCEPFFLEWYGDVVIFIYREKHRTYIARVGFDPRPNFHAMRDDWVLDGYEIGYCEYDETMVSRLSVPSLEPLPKLSEAEAAARGLQPRSRWT